MLENLKVGKGEVDADVIAVGRILPTNVYQGICKHVRTFKTQNNVAAAEIVYEIGSRDYKQTFYLTNSKGSTLDSKGNTKRDLLKLESFARITTGSPLSQLTEETVEIPLWDYDLKKMVKTECSVIKEFTNVPVFLAIQEIIEDKTRRSASGEWEPTNESVSKNEIVKFLDEEGRTITELVSDADPEFAVQWKEKNENQVWDRRDKSKGASAADGTSSAAPTTTATSTGSVAGMFAKK